MDDEFDYPSDALREAVEDHLERLEKFDGRTADLPFDLADLPADVLRRAEEHEASLRRLIYCLRDWLWNRPRE